MKGCRVYYVKINLQCSCFFESLVLIFLTTDYTDCSNLFSNFQNLLVKHLSVNNGNHFFSYIVTKHLLSGMHRCE